MNPKEISSAITIAVIWLLVLLFSITMAVGCAVVYQDYTFEIKADASYEEPYYEPIPDDERNGRNLPIHTF